MSKIAEKELWNTLEDGKTVDETSGINSDKDFITNLSKWVVKNYGNVNVAQRLNIIAIGGKLSK